MRILKFILFSLLFLPPGYSSGSLVSFTSTPTAGDTTESEFILQYDLGQPDQIIELPESLKEISGLSLSTDGKHLIAVQDEDGLVFLIDKGSGALSEQFEFWKEGDYEGIEMVGEEIFVVKSTGTVYRIQRAGTDNQHVIKYNFFLNKENDVEGMGYDVRHHRLLLACKADAGPEQDFQFKKGIYGFSLNSMSLDSLPCLSVSLEEVQQFLKARPDLREYDKLVERFIEEDSEFTFSPSALAVHPLTGHVYITSSKGKVLIVLTPEGQVVHIEKLEKSTHCQPEGICFDRDGTLYIANEGKKDRVASILRFPVQAGR